MIILMVIFKRNLLLFVYLFCINFNIFANLQNLYSIKNRYGEIRRDNCVSTCFDLKPSNLVLEISDSDNKTSKSIAIIYKCPINEIDVYDPLFNKNKYVKLCGNRIETCEPNLVNIKYAPVKQTTKNQYKIPVSVVVPHSSSSIFYKYITCKQEPLRFSLKIDKHFLYQNQIIFPFNVMRQIRMPNKNVVIKLSIWKNANEHLTEIDFYITKNRTDIVSFTESNFYTSKLTNEQNIKSFVSIFDKIFNENQNYKVKLSKALSMVTKIPLIYKQSLNSLDSNQRAKISNSIIKNVQNLMKNVSIEVKNKNSSYQQISDSFVIYSSVVTKPQMLIPSLNLKNETNVQFVEINIKEKDKIKTGSSLVANFILYKDMDIMNEYFQIQNQIRNKNLIIHNKRQNFTERKIERYKNSDIMYLSLSRHTNLTVNFILRKINKLQSPSWLYLYEEECGYLDKNSDWSWSTKGCKIVKGSDSHHYCRCDHLSNFAMLFTIKPINAWHLLVTGHLSIFSGIINIISLSLFLTFILHINPRDKLRLDQLNIAICLLIGTIIFIFGGFNSMNKIACKLTALLAQFFFLSAFNWKLIYGVNVIRMMAFLKYENENKLRKYRIASTLSSYSVSFLIVFLSGITQWKYYGKIADDVCWIESQSPAFLTFIIPIGIILVVNIVCLIVISIHLFKHFIKSRKIKVNKSNESIIFFQLVITMGMTWVPSYFAIVYLEAMYMWIICFPLQGLLLMLLVVVINKENRAKVSSFVKDKYNSLISKTSQLSPSNFDSKFKSRSVSKTSRAFIVDESETNSTLLNSPNENKLLLSETSTPNFQFKELVNKVKQASESNTPGKVLLVPGSQPIFFKS